MGLDTPLFLGTEKLARKLDAAVVFLKIRKVAGDNTRWRLNPSVRIPTAMEPYEITEAHVRILENLITEEPEFWLWSHRRWKHSIEKYMSVHE